MDRQLTINSSSIGTILVWYLGTSSLAVWSSPHVDYSNQLYSIGWYYQVLTGAAKGTTVFGQDPLWLAWVTDLVNLEES